MLRRPRFPSSWLIALPLVAFAAYGMVSLPGLVAHWGLSAAVPPLLAGWLALTAAPIILARRGHDRLAVAAALVAALAPRLVLAALVAHRMPAGDARMYPLLADHMRHGRGLEVFEPFMGVETRALFPPLYPMLLGLWSMVAGLSTPSVTVLGFAIDVAAAAAIAILGRTLGRPAVGRGAAWLYLMWPSVLLSAPLAQKEGLCALLCLLLALQWVRYAQGPRGSVREAAAIGVTAGLLALTQPGELPLAALFGIVAIGGGVRRLLVVNLAAIPAAAAAVMLPWWVRNAVVFGTFVPLTSAGGYGLWIGNNPNANGHWLPPPAVLYGLPEIAFGKAAARLAVMWIEAHPIGFLRVTLAKALRGWGLAEFGASRLADLRPPVSPRVVAGLVAVAQTAHLGLLTGAAWAARRLRDPGLRALLLLVVACLAQTLCFGSLFEFGERHRDFATPFLLLLVMAGVHEKAVGIAADGPFGRRPDQAASS